MNLNIDYLDLALREINRKIAKVEQFTHKYYFNNQFKHSMHGENPQLNSIIDLIISLGTHLGKQEKNISPKAITSQEVLFNLEYIINQNTDVLRTIGFNRNNSPNLQNLRRIEEKYNQIEQLLREIKQLIKT